MKQVRLICLFGLLPLMMSRGEAAGGWASLKKGMTLNQVVNAIGMPLVSSKGRGMDLWIYDSGGETLAMGGILTEWTQPKKVIAIVLPVKSVTPPPAPVVKEKPVEEYESRSNRPSLRMPLR